MLERLKQSAALQLTSAIAETAQKYKAEAEHQQQSAAKVRLTALTSCLKWLGPLAGLAASCLPSDIMQLPTTASQQKQGEMNDSDLFPSV